MVFSPIVGLRCANPTYNIYLDIYLPAPGCETSMTRRQILQQQYDAIPAGRQCYGRAKYRMLGERKKRASLVIFNGINRPVDLLPLLYFFWSLAGQLGKPAFQALDSFSFSSARLIALIPGHWQR